FFFLDVQRRTRSTRFPYSTLFRSEDDLLPVEPGREASRRARDVVTVPVDQVRHRAGERRQDEHTGGRRAREGARLQERPQQAPSDRKSTRLNSSHVKISYAVFCLK